MILDDIIKKTKEDLEKRKIDYTVDWLGRSLAYNPYQPRPVREFLTATKDDPIKIIAEVKKASPSKGIIREDFNPEFIAQEYSKNGADAISVLTEPHFFQGNLEYLTGIRRYVKTPLLRKDFIVDEYQLLEALVYGADFVLLIATALSTKDLQYLYDRALTLGLDVLV
jgi:indole-3-glycerol phosphate synthase